MRTFRRILVASMAASLAIASPMRAQSVVYSTFGTIGNGYRPFEGYLVSNLGNSPGWSAAGFTYAGSQAVNMFSLRLPFFKNDVDLADGTGAADGGAMFIDFLGGPALASASVLHSWSFNRTTPSASVEELFPTNNVTLAPGTTYWIRARFGTPDPMFWG